MKSHEHIFMIGIGGMGMAPLALFLKERGYSVSGYDDHMRLQVREILTCAGIELVATPNLPASVTRVVRSSAVTPAHPIMVQAKSRGLPTLRRGEMLAEQSRDYKLVAIAGSHGKTTTTAMLISGLKATGFAANYVLGGLFADSLAPAAAVDSEWLVAEVDESDGTIDGFNPTITILVNLDWDHADYYQNPAAIESAFARLFSRTTQAIIVPEGDPSLGTLSGSALVPVHSVGPTGTFTFRLEKQSPDSMQLHLSGAYDCSAAMVKAAGQFNAANAAAALATAQLMGAQINPIALSNYPGVRRRQTKLFQAPGITVYQDYAHHPAEIEALLRFVRDNYPERRLVTIFQPHRYSRTLQFKQRFAEVLSRCDRVLLLQVYAASELPIAGGTSEAVLSCMDAGTSAQLVTQEAELARLLGEESGSPRVVLFVGAGDIEDWADTYVKHLGLQSHPGIQVVHATNQPPEWWSRLRLSLSDETRLALDEPIGKKTTFGVGGNSRYYAEPANADDLQRILHAAHKAGVEVFLLGRGSNLLVTDAGYKGLVIRLTGKAWQTIHRLDENTIEVGCGVKLKQLCADAVQLGLEGFEFCDGIPGTLGGALRMNAGAMGGWMFDRVESIEFMTLEGGRYVLPHSAFEAGYRCCVELKDAIAISAVLRAKGQASPETIKARIEANAAKRKASQPREPSAGCVFKNPPGDHAGRIIDELGLKGFSIGGAQVSPMHGNFIVNTGDASSSDVIALVREIRATARLQRNITLEPEVLLLGTKWEDIL
ncbi:MAG: UDP-N-acetylmuramate dehydrogenase [Verrucomicrobiota bacterium]|nr:UDP-N-acetylmuramate dehydrogenase [Verrucomicrobiota bacterium]